MEYASVINCRGIFVIMENDLKKSILILALSNLIDTYNILLEDKEYPEKDKEYLSYIIEKAGELLISYNPNLETPRPTWESLM